MIGVELGLCFGLGLGVRGYALVARARVRVWFRVRARG